MTASTTLPAGGYASIRPFLIEESLRGSMLVCKFLMPPSKTIVISAVSFRGKKKWRILITQLRILFFPWLSVASITAEVKSAHRKDWEEAVVMAFLQIQKLE